MAKCSELVNDVNSAFQSLTLRFGLSPNAKLDETFLSVNSFVLGLEKCRKDNLREEKMRSMAEKRKAKQPRPIKVTFSRHFFLFCFSCFKTTTTQAVGSAEQTLRFTENKASAEETMKLSAIPKPEATAEPPVKRKVLFLLFFAAYD